jgi:hypothetical protein
MSDTLVIGYGGQGCFCARAYSVAYSLPAVLMNIRTPEEEPELFQEFVELTDDPQLNRGRLRNLMDGYRYVLLVSSFGGLSLQNAYAQISECARELKITLITLCTVPFMFEPDRRERAYHNLSEFAYSVDNLFVIDLQKAITDSALGVNYNIFLSKTAESVAHLMRILVNLLEYSPFYSYCSDPYYTVALGSDPLYLKAVENALAHPFFDVPPNCGKILVFSDRVPNDLDKIQVASLLSAKGNALPEFAGFTGLGKDYVLLFIPISSRRP